MEERNEYSNHLDELKKRIEKFEEENNLNKIQEQFKKMVKKKDNEILQLQTKLIFQINKNKTLENKIYMNSFNDNNKNNKNLITNDLIKNKTARVTNIKNKISEKEKKECQSYRNIYIPINKIKNKRFLLRTMSSSFINSSNLENDFFNNKKINNSSIGESVNNFIFNINENTSNKDIEDKKNKHRKIKINLNIPNDNLNKNNTMINYNSNIDKETINIEKIKIQKKLAEYHKLIDKKLNNIKSNKHFPITKNKKNINNSCIKLKIFGKEGKSISEINNMTTIPLKNDNYKNNKKKVKSKSNKTKRNKNKNFFNMF